MSLSAATHRRTGWLLAAAWTVTGLVLVLGLPRIEEVGEVVVFAQWSIVALPVAAATWCWAFVGRWRSAVALSVLGAAVLAWALLYWLGRDAWIQLAIRDAFFLRRPTVELSLRVVLWGYLVYPLGLMTGGVTAVVEYLRHPPAAVRARAQRLDA